MAQMRKGGANQPKQFEPYQHQEAVTRLSESQNNFTRDLYLALAKENSGKNLFFSPWSVLAALAMTRAGCKSNTLAQLTKALHIPEDALDVHEAFSDIIQDINKVVPDYELKTSNMAYVAHVMPLLKEYGEILANQFQASAKNVDFGKGEEVRAEINEKVAKETNNKIKDLIPSGVLDSLTRLVLVNAVYFKGMWDKKFKEQNTKTEPFYITEDQKVDVPMMNIKDKFKIGQVKELDASVLSLDYQGSRLSMMILLPSKKCQLAELEKKLVDFDLRKLDKCLSNREVILKMPKFKLEESYSMVDTLKGMGVTDLFDDQRADLSGIADEKGLFVSQVVHKAFLEVNEEGSEAAAATAVVMMVRSMPMRPPGPFHCDHPFLFIIRDNRSGFAVFSGRYNGPSTQSSSEKQEL